MKTSRLGALLLFAGLLLCYFAAFASAQPDASSVLQRLDDPDYAMRQRATRELLRDPTLTVQMVEAWLAQADTPEQRHRLMDVARHHLLRALREREEGEATMAAIGFSHEVLPEGTLPQLDSGAVHIVQTLPGFPGHAHLDPGDVVVAVDDRPLPSDLTATVFQELLRRYRPGQTLALTVLRGGERVRVELQLASMELLSRIYADEGTLRQPYAGEWAMWRERLLATAPETPVLSVAAAAEGEGRVEGGE